MKIRLTELIPPIASEVLGAVAASAVALGVPYIAYKFSALNDFHVVLYGVEGVDSFDGIVGSVELLNEEVEDNGETISEHDRQIQAMTSELAEVKKKIDKSHEKIEEMESRVNSNEKDVEEARDKMSGLERRVDALYRSIKQRNE